MNKFCCKKLKRVWGLILDSQDLNELFKGCCPYCGKNVTDRKQSKVKSAESGKEMK